MAISYKLVAGLGNPGSEYANTRHNMGFMLLEKFIREHRPERWEKLHICNSFCYVGNYAGSKLILQFPQTYMNNSGQAVAKLMRQEKIEPSELIVVYDDMDLAPGRLRIRRNGASGGHHGIDSIISELGNRGDFSRLRLGIGHGRETVDHVLSGFDASELPAVEAALATGCKALETMLRCGVGKAMNEFNSWSYTAPETENTKADQTNIETE
jgi:PTH1 family peptidyl-tRNA hydrolase